MRLNHILGREEVRKYLKNNLTFIETGTYKGEGLDYVSRLNYFSYFYSCDISDDEYTQESIKKWKDSKKHTIKIQNSLDFLQDVLPTISNAALFWLDAHYPFQYNNKIQDTKETKYPVFQELDLIKKLKNNYKNDIILCDDIRVIYSDDNPKKTSPGNNAVESYHLIHDKTFSDLTSILSDTHFYFFIGDCLVFIPLAFD